MDDQQKQQPLKLRPRTERIAKLRKQHTAIAKAAVEAAYKTAPVGQKMEDGSIFAGLTADGQRIFAMPTDLDVTMTFNDAAKRVRELNADKALGHNDWQIPALGDLHILQENQNEGSLKGTFNTTNKGGGSDLLGMYWSSTEDHSYPSYVHNVRFSDGIDHWTLKDSSRFFCRPVRLVAASSPAPR